MKNLNFLAGLQAKVPKTTLEIPVIEKEVSSSRVQVTKMKNGASVMTESPTFPGPVYVAAGFRSGSRNMPGILMGLKEMHKYSLSNTQADFLQRLGSGIEVKFDQEFTGFFSVSLAHDTKKLAKVLFESIFLQFDQKLFKKIEEISKLEILNRELTMNDWVSEIALSQFYKKGLKNSLFELGSLQKTNEYVQRFHTSQNLCVFGSGVNNHFEFLDLVSGYLKDLPESEENVWEKEEFEEKVVNLNENIEFGCYSLCVPFYGLGSKEYYHMQVIKHLLKILSSQAIITQSLLSDVQVALHIFSDTSLYIISLIGSPNSQKTAVQVFNTLFDGLSNASQDMIQAAKTKAKFDLFLLSESHAERHKHLLKSYLLTKKAEDLKASYSEVDNIQTQDLKNTIFAFLSSQRSYLNIGPAFR